MNKGELYSGIVWLLSALTLFIYATLSVTNQNVPGVEQFVDYLQTVDGFYIYSAAFLSIFIEGLYVVSNFFPGATLVLVLAIVSQIGGVGSFLLTILAIFSGWCLAGVVNIFGAKFFGMKFLKRYTDDSYEVVSRPFTTWFPVFRANYEVAQIMEGGDVWQVLWSSIKVKLLASFVAMLYVAAIPYFVDINEVSNEEGALSVLVVALISFSVGIFKLRRYLKVKEI